MNAQQRPSTLQLPANIHAYLRGQFEHGQPILFLGAGSSLGATSLTGGQLPTASTLSRELWDLCYPGELYEQCELQDIFQKAMSSQKRALSEFLGTRFTVDFETLPDYYGSLFSLPWCRVYSLNIDDLPLATARRFPLPRRPRVISALRSIDTHMASSTDDLEWICLNGLASDGVDGVTFSRTQYAERLASKDPLMARCVAELVTRPVVFIGTELDEPHLWQHLRLRGSAGTGVGEFRKKSFLVSPKISRPRRETLRNEHNVEYVPLGLEEFVSEVLGPIAGSVEPGLAAIRASAEAAAPLEAIPEVTALAAGHVGGDAEFLLGRAPVWADVQGGFAVIREFDNEVLSEVERMAAEKTGSKLLLLSGTAGSGKSTTAMRLAVRLSAQGRRVGWLDPDAELRLAKLKAHVGASGLEFIIIDDVERFGVEGPALLKACVESGPVKVVVATVRATKASRTIDGLRNQQTRFVEKGVPHLTDADIVRLLEALDRGNRLGVLKGLSQRQRVEAFRVKAGRQLLVAMLEATSGVSFEERIVNELTDLDPLHQDVYAFACVATSINSSVSRDEFVQVLEAPSNDTLAAVDDLIRRKVLVAREGSRVEARHRVIADRVLAHCAGHGMLGRIVAQVLLVSSMKVVVGVARESKEYRRVRRLMNHQWLKETVGNDDARRALENVEQLLHWDYHYWLQRGALELELGSLSLARNFLDQALALEPGDALVMTERGYLACKVALSEPSATDARDQFETGEELLNGAIRKRGDSDPHAFQILGDHAASMGRRQDLDPSWRLEMVRRAVGQLERGQLRHPSDTSLKDVLTELKRTRALLVD